MKKGSKPRQTSNGDSFRAPLVRCACEILNRTDRVKRYLEQTEERGPIEYRTIVEIVRAGIASSEEIAIDSLCEVLRHDPKADKEGLGDAEDTLYQVLRIVAKVLVNLHEYLAYLPRNSVPAEAHSALTESFGQEFRETKPAIILGSIFNAKQIDIKEILKDSLIDILPRFEDLVGKDSRSIVIQLPMCEHDSPTSWSLLAHEFGHAIDRQYKISERAAEEHVKRKQPDLFDFFDQLCSEFAADLIAAKAFGPSAILSVLSLDYCYFPVAPFYMERTDLDHPTTKWRLKVVSDFLGTHPSLTGPLKSEASLLDQAVNASLHFRVPDNAKRREFAKKENSMMTSFISEVIPFMVREVEKLKYAELDWSANSHRRCLERLGNGFPIGAQGLDRKTLTRRIQQYRRKTDAKDISPQQSALEFQKLLKEFAEKPLSSAMILFAGHCRRAEIFRSIYESTVTLSKEDIRAKISALSNTELLMMASLKSSGVHRLLPSNGALAEAAEARGSIDKN